MLTIVQLVFQPCASRVKRIRFTIAALSGCVVLLGLFSAGAKPTNQPPLPVWPPPPADARIVYVRDICGPKDIGSKPSALVRLANWITGVEPKKNDLDKPFGLTLDESGNLLVTDSGNNRVCFLDLAHKRWSFWKAAGGQPFLSPVAAAHRGKFFYVADSAAGKVIAFDEKGKAQFSITNGLHNPSGLALLDDRLLIADSQQHQIVVCDLKGKFINAFGRRGRGPGEFNFPTHVSVDSSNHIYVTDSMNYRVQVFDAAGNFLRAFGSAGDGPGRFSRPKGVASDSDGHVYVVDALFDNVQIFDGSGRLLLDWGGSGSDPGKFWLPNGIVINSRNEIFVADTYNRRIQMFRYIGKP
jgi:DNA-binding beta-propeller fold protein YncE